MSLNKGQIKIVLNYLIEKNIIENKQPTKYKFYGLKEISVIRIRIKKVFFCNKCSNCKKTIRIIKCEYYNENFKVHLIVNNASIYQGYLVLKLDGRKTEVLYDSFITIDD